MYGHILLTNGNLKDSFHTILHFCSEFEVFAIIKKYFFLVCLFRLGFGQFDQSELQEEGFVWTHTVVKWQSFLYFSQYFALFAQIHILFFQVYLFCFGQSTSRFFVLIKNI